MVSIYHENLTKVLGIFTNKCIYITEYSKRGTLELSLRDPAVFSVLTKAQRLSVLLDVITALQRLIHTSPIKNNVPSLSTPYHGDLRSASIVLADDFTAKVDLSRSAWVTQASGFRNLFSRSAMIENYYNHI